MAFKDNLISWWSLDEESGNRADSHGSQTLSDNATVLYGAGIQGNAADFEVGQSEFLSRASEAALQTGDIDFSFVAWLKLESNVARMMVLAKDQNGEREYGMEIDLAQEDDLYFSVYTAGDTNVQVASGSGALSNGVWYFAFFSYNAATNIMSMSVDDGTVTTNEGVGPLQAADVAVFQMGAREYTGNRDYFDGLVDEVGFWKRALTSSEVTWLYNGGAGRTYSELDAFIPTSTGIF